MRATIILLIILNSFRVCSQTDCDPPRINNVTFTFTSTNDGKYYATNSINATNSVNDVIYLAANDIKLKEEFKATPIGSDEVKLVIKSCDFCNTCLDFGYVEITQETSNGFSFQWIYGNSRTCAETACSFSFDWDFGDGTTEMNSYDSTYHTYSSTGVYNLNVTAHFNDTSNPNFFYCHDETLPSCSYATANTLTINAIPPAQFVKEQAEEVVLEKDSFNDLSTTVYPNPSENVYTIFGNAVKIDNVISVIDLNGRIVYNEKCKDNQNTQLDLAGLQSGVYLLYIYEFNGTSSFVCKLFKK